MTDPTKIGNFFENLPKFALNLGVSFLVTGGLLYYAISFGFIEKSSLNGYPAEAAPVLIVVGAASLLSMILIFLAKWTMKLPSIVSDDRKAKKEKADKTESMIDNIRLVSDEAKLFLLASLRRPQGRISAVANFRPFLELYELKIVSEEEFSYVISLVPEGIMRVNTLIFEKKNVIIPSLVEHLSPIFDIDASDEEQVVQKVADILRQNGLLR